MEVDANPVPTKTNPLGVKGVGEAGCVGALPAVVNALVAAETMTGRDGHTAHALPHDLLVEAMVRFGRDVRSPG